MLVHIDADTISRARARELHVLVVSQEGVTRLDRVASLFGDLPEIKLPTTVPVVPKDGDSARTFKVASGVTADRLGIFGIAANDIYVVGAQSTLLHYNGTSFTPVPGPTPSLSGRTGGSSWPVTWAGSSPDTPREQAHGRMRPPSRASRHGARPFTRCRAGTMICT